MFYCYLFSTYTYISLSNEAVNKWVILYRVTQGTGPDMSEILTMAGAVGNESKQMKPELFVDVKQQTWNWPDTLVFEDADDRALFSWLILD